MATVDMSQQLLRRLEEDLNLFERRGEHLTLGTEGMLQAEWEDPEEDENLFERRGEHLTMGTEGMLQAEWEDLEEDENLFGRTGEDLITSTADMLVMSMLSWIKQRDELATKLLALANELESLKKKYDARATNCSTALMSEYMKEKENLMGASKTGAGPMAILLKRKRSPPVGQDHMSKIIETEEKSNETAKNIQGQFNKLRAEKKKVSSSADPDAVDRHIMTDLMGAMAKNSGLKDQFDVRTFEYESGLFSDAGPATMQDSLPVRSPMAVALLGLLAFFSLNIGGKRFKLLINEGAKRLINTVSSHVFKNPLKEHAMAVGGAVGMAFDLPKAIKEWKDLIKKDDLTEAGRSLRDTADDISEIDRILREQFGNITKRLKMLNVVRCSMDDVNRSAELRRIIINHVKNECNDDVVREWLEEHGESPSFFTLVDTFIYLKNNLSSANEIFDIIFVAHGSIGEAMIPSKCLVPVPNIIDVLLYSPWNCLLGTDAAYGIIMGTFMRHHRHFCCSHRGCPIRPIKNIDLPDHWNSMRAAGGWWIPNISLTTINASEDPSWKHLNILEQNFGSPERHRHVIPLFGNPPSTIPFFIVMMALSCVLYFCKFRPTVHLCACLGRANGQNPCMEHTTMQYARTIDHTRMTTNQNMDPHRQTGLYRLLSQVFDL